MLKGVGKVLFPTEVIQTRVKELAAQITKDYQDKEIIVVGILTGAFIFMADLIREIKLPLTVDFIDVASYGSSTYSSGVVRIVKDLEKSINGAHVLIVEDIVDTGLTLNYIIQNLLSRHPASLKICAFLDKPSRRQVAIKVDYLGYKIADEFVVGYGLDFAEKYRYLPYIAVLAPEEYMKR